MKRLHLALGAVLAGAAGLAYRGGPGADVAGVPPQVSRAVATGAAVKTVAAVAILALRPRADLVGAAGEGGADDRFAAHDDLFLPQDWRAPQVDATAPAAMPVPASVPAPAAPALPFVYIGKAFEAGAWDVFLARAGQVHVVRLDSVIDGQYRVAAIAPPVMRLTYLPLNQAQQIDIGGAD